MKTIIILVFGFMTAQASVAFAGDHAANKLYRGVANIVTAPVEVPKQARAYWIKGAQKTDHILVWIGTGAIWGMVQGIKRIGSGVWDVVSFPVDIPKDNEPLLKPAYVFDEWPVNRAHKGCTNK